LQISWLEKNCYFKKKKKEFEEMQVNEMQNAMNHDWQNVTLTKRLSAISMT
jgi:hypothetical protein